LSVLIEDSPRAYLANWISAAVARGAAHGAIISPWATPWISHPGQGKKPRAQDRIQELLDNGVEVWFDPTTHALQMGSVGDFRYYAEYDLWGGPRGDLSDDALREEHVGKVFDIQETLNVPHLAPTVLLHSGLDSTSALALEIAREAVRRDPDCRLSIAGTAPFWSSGPALDAHIGALATLEPSGWFLTVVRTATSLPVPAIAEEVHGLCRTARALSEDSPMHISHGDLAALPAIAAGATTVGSGWDQRQRVCSYGDYGARDPDAAGGGWYQRPSLRALLGSVLPNDAIILAARDAALVTRLGGLPAPGPRETFDHHLDVLTTVITDLQAISNPEQRYRRLLTLYDAARAEWPIVQGHTGSAIGGDEWIDGVAAGLALYGRTEGW
jgi:hypothetical protein